MARRILTVGLAAVAGALLLAAGAAAQLPPSRGEPAGSAARDSVSASVLDEVEVDSVSPGKVATLTLRVAMATPPGGPVRYRLTPSPGIRLLMGNEGALTPGADGTLLLPVTFGVPRDQPVGPLLVATAELLREDGQIHRVALRTRVRASYQLTVTVPEPPAIAAGGTGEVAYELRNGGNTVDTVQVQLELGTGWTGDPQSETVVLGIGEEVRRVVRIRSPEDATPGEERHLQLRAVAGGGTVIRTAAVRVAHRADMVGGLAHVPGTLFVGAGNVGSGAGASLSDLAFALSGSGQIGVGTELSVSAVRQPGRGALPGLWSHLSGPRFRVGVRRAGFGGALGDVSAAPGLLLQQSVMGTGAGMQWDRDGNKGEVLVARTGLDRSGHALLYRHQVGSPAGQLGLQLSDVETGHPFGQRTQLAALTLEQSRSVRSRVRAEFGAYRLLLSGGKEFRGPVGAVEYSTTGDHGSLWTRARHAPSLSGADGAESELSVGGRLPVLPSLDLDGWAYAHLAPVGRRGERESFRGGYLGGRTTLGATAFRLGVADRESLASSARAERWRRTLVAGAQTSLGPLSLSTGADLGRVERVDGRADQIRQLRADVSWSSGNAQVWASTTYLDQGVAESVPRASLGWTLRGERSHLQGGLGAPLAGPNRRSGTHLWSSVSLPAVRGVELVVGTEYQPWQLESPWRVSLGVRRSISMPLPMPVMPVSSGVVFEDRNGNGLRDPEEPGVEGVVLHRAGIRVVTDAHGSFSIRTGSANATLRLDAGSLPGRLVLPADVVLRPVGRVEIPVIRPARMQLRLRLVQAVPGQGVGAYPTRSPRGLAAAGALVTLTGPSGRVRQAAAGPDGEVVFTSMPPGTYAVRVEGSPTTPGRVSPADLEIVLAAGQEVTREVELEYRPREIRMGTGGRSGGGR